MNGATLFRETPLAPARRTGPFAASAVVHLVVGALLCVSPRQQVELRPVVVASEHDSITYVPVTELPAIGDAEGAQKGVSGVAGGRHLFRPSQPVRVTREDEIRREIVDAPRLKLPITTEPIAGLVAFARERAPQLAEQPMEVANGKSPRFFRSPDPANAPDVKLSQRPIADLLAQRRELTPALAEQPIAVANGKSRRLRRDAPSASVPLVNVNRRPEVVSDLLEGVPAPKLPAAPEPMAVRQGSGKSRQRDVSAPAVTAGMVGPSAPALPDRSYSAAVILSEAPGRMLGTRPAQQGGSTAMSRIGGDTPGLGMAPKGGSGVSNGDGPGAAPSGAGPGRATSGPGKGKNADARGGATPYGPDAGGGKTDGDVVIEGLTITGGPAGGSGQVYLGSFAMPPTEQQMPLGPRKNPAVMVMGTARSGGVLQAYASEPRGRVYTIYVATGIGTAVVEFSQAGPARQAFDADLTAPEPLEASLPPELRGTPIVIGCLMDRSGRLTQVRLLQQMTAELSAKLTRAIAAWRFRPVLHGDQPVEASVLIGMHLNPNAR